MANKESKRSDALKITWGELKNACEHAGVKDNDTLDFAHITWGSVAHLKCHQDEDFVGWQIELDCDC